MTKLANKRSKSVTTRSEKETLAWSVRGFGREPSHMTDDRYTGRFGTIIHMWTTVYAAGMR